MNNTTNQYTLIENKSKKYPNGSIWDSKSCGKFTIIGKTNKHNKKNSYIYCLCQFQDGTIVESDFTNIKNGNIKNPYHPTVYGVGYMGQGIWSSKFQRKATKEYMLWIHMLNRCYSEKFLIKNPSYKGVTVSEKWFCFQNFCNDIQFISKYNEWKNDKTDKWELDKDILCEKNKIFPKSYSLETCMFITKKENISESTSRKNLTGLTYVAIDPNGEKYEFLNQKEFAKNNNLNVGLIRDCIHNNRNQYKGWKFYIKNS